MSTIEGPYKGQSRPFAMEGEGEVIVPSDDDRLVCKTDDVATAEIIASALNLWEMGSEDDTLDQLTAAHQMNLALSKRVQEMQGQIDALKNRVPTDAEDYGDNLVGTGEAMLKKAGKAGSYDLSTFDSARLSGVSATRRRVSNSGEDVVSIKSTIELRKKCIRSGTYDGGDDTPIGGFKGVLFGGK